MAPMRTTPPAVLGEGRAAPDSPGWGGSGPSAGAAPGGALRSAREPSEMSRNGKPSAETDLVLRPAVGLVHRTAPNSSGMMDEPAPHVQELAEPAVRLVADRQGSPRDRPRLARAAGLPSRRRERHLGGRACPARSRRGGRGRCGSPIKAMRGNFALGHEEAGLVHEHPAPVVTQATLLHVPRVHTRSRRRT